MIVVIQCAARKRANCGHLTTSEGTPVVFVAHPETAPRSRRHIYARPDDDAGRGTSWRNLLLRFNRDPGDNKLGLLRAHRLYKNPIYSRFVDKLGVDRVFILSAGWGLIRADFLTPNYDITFSPNARGEDAYKRRRKGDAYQDFCMLPEDSTDEIFFFGGKDYVPLFCSLTANVRGRRNIFHSSARAPEMPNCLPVRFETTTRTNWHYECANRFLALRFGPAIRTAADAHPPPAVCAEGGTR